MRRRRRATVPFGEIAICRQWAFTGLSVPTQDNQNGKYRSDPDGRQDAIERKAIERSEWYTPASNSAISASCAEIASVAASHCRARTAAEGRLAVLSMPERGRRGAIAALTFQS